MSAPDRSIFSIFVQHSRGAEAVVDPLMTQATVVERIAAGEYDEIAYITESNPVEGWCRDVTEDIAIAVADYAKREGLTLPQSIFNWCQEQDAIPLGADPEPVSCGQFRDGYYARAWI